MSVNQVSYRPQLILLQRHVKRIHKVIPSTANQHEYLSVPTGGFRLALNIHKKATPTNGGRAQALGPVLLRGSDAAPVTVKPLADQEQYSVIFEPYGLASFTRIPLTELATESLDGSDVFGAAINDLREELLEFPDDLRNFQRIEEFLLRSYQPSKIELVSSAMELIESGQYFVQDICSILGCEERTLRRHFKKYTGVSVKRAIQLHRLGCVWKVMKSNPDVPNVEIAYNHGYSDQSHYNHELRQLTGLTPKEIRSFDQAAHY